MNIIKCSVGGCESVFQTEEAVSPKATFLCRFHTPRHKPEPGDRFQPFQFDRSLRRAGRPVGTSHIQKQGSDVETAEHLNAIHGIPEHYETHLLEPEEEDNEQ